MSAKRSGRLIAARRAGRTAQASLSAEQSLPGCLKNRSKFKQSEYLLCAYSTRTVRYE